MEVSHAFRDVACVADVPAKRVLFTCHIFPLLIRHSDSTFLSIWSSIQLELWMISVYQILYGDLVRAETTV
jgi:methyl coenzyme M reductase alpha subunit